MVGSEAKMAASAPAGLGATTVEGRPKLHGRAFYESIGSPKFILAPMVDQSEFAWRMLTRSFMKPEDRKKILAYSPMLHARLFAEATQYRSVHFEPVRDGMEELPRRNAKADFLDGRADIDRPLTVQFCANDPEELLSAAKYVSPFCDAVDLNLGCPQGIARKGKYGAFLQEDWDLVSRLIRKLHEELDIPVTAKCRILETREKTLEYVQKIIGAGASILAVHGRQREQKGHMTGLADWNVIRYLRDNLPKEVVMFANGNILRHEDIDQCIEATGVDGVMSAEGNLSDPSVFAAPPEPGQEGREYWRGRDGKGGWRMDAVFRRYMDIIYEYVLETPPPARRPLFMPTDPEAEDLTPKSLLTEPVREEESSEPPRKRQKRSQKKDPIAQSPNIVAMQPHLFHLLKPLVSVHTDVRDALARCRRGGMEAYERVLGLTENAVKQGLLEYERNPSQFEEQVDTGAPHSATAEDLADHDSSAAAVKACKRPYWVCQPYVRPVPKEALQKGALHLSKKELKKVREQNEQQQAAAAAADEDRDDAGNKLEGTADFESAREKADAAAGGKVDEIPKEAMVAG